MSHTIGFNAAWRKVQTIFADYYQEKWSFAWHLVYGYLQNILSEMFLTGKAFEGRREETKNRNLEMYSLPFFASIFLFPLDSFFSSQFSKFTNFLNKSFILENLVFGIKYCLLPGKEPSSRLAKISRDTNYVTSGSREKEKVIKQVIDSYWFSQTNHSKPFIYVYCFDCS